MSLRVVPADALCVLLSYIAKGSWHLPCRLVCRDWSGILSAPGGADAAYACMRPWETIQERRDDALVEWARTAGVPWSPRTMDCLALRGDFEGLAWSVRRVVPTGGLSPADRVELTAQVVRGGPEVLARAAVIGGTPPLLHWTSAALVRAVQYHGRGRSVGRFPAVWDRCLDLCAGGDVDGEGWTLDALRAAVVTADTAAVRTIMRHADCSAALRDDARWRQCLDECCGMRRRRGVAVFRLLADAGDGAARRLPWSALEEAAEAGNAAVVAAFLAHPRCPVDRSGESAALSTLAVVARPRTAQQAATLLTLLMGAGITLHRDVLRVGVRFAAIETVEWLLFHGADHRLSTEELFLFAIHAGRLDVVEFLHAQRGGIATDNVLFTRTAAEMGHADILARLRMWDCVWDHGVLQSALLNNHIGLARWAVAQGCPLTTGPISASDEARLRDMIGELVH